jgi:pimeloyl-ACP methyl ester carboxylesterase
MDPKSLQCVASRFFLGNRRRFDQKMPHITTVLEDLTVHFIHPRSTHDRESILLLLIHGWPGTWYDFARIIDPLTNPRSQDGNNTPSFHVVIHIAPGFCWSNGPKRQMWTQKDSTRIYDELMKRLGYDTYAVHGTDYGGFAARELAAKYTSSYKAMHTTFCPSEPPIGKALTERERWANERIDWFNRSQLGYA